MKEIERKKERDWKKEEIEGKEAKVVMKEIEGKKKIERMKDERKR